MSFFQKRGCYYGLYEWGGARGRDIGPLRDSTSLHPHRREARPCLAFRHPSGLIIPDPDFFDHWKKSGFVFDSVQGPELESVKIWIHYCLVWIQILCFFGRQLPYIKTSKPQYPEALPNSRKTVCMRSFRSTGTFWTTFSNYLQLISRVHSCPELQYFESHQI